MTAQQKIRLALLYGGCSGEHEISLLSASSVLHALDKSRFDVVPIGIDKQGQWFVNPLQKCLDLDSSSLEITVEGTVPMPWQDSKLQLLNGRLDAVFPVMHGPLYEDGCLQGLLELANIPYVGPGVLSSAVAMDKDVAKRLVLQSGIDTAKHIVLKSSMTATQIEQQCERAFAELGPIVFVKPARMGSSVGTHRADTVQDILRAVQDAFQYDDKLIIEAFVKGQEIELAVLENDTLGEPALVSVPGEICVSAEHDFYSYEAKYCDPNATTLMIPAGIDATLQQRARAIAQQVFDCLSGEGMARVDLFVEHETGRILFNEMNTIPGFTDISMYPKLWEASGIGYSELLSKLVDLALLRHHNKQKLITDYL